jgi:hypothetical protein
MKLVLSIILLFLLTACDAGFQNETSRMLKETRNSKYQIGQVWEYNTRPSELNSTITIVKVEDHPTGRIIHVYIDAVRVRTDIKEDEYSTIIYHAPFAEAAIDLSVTKLQSTLSELPEYEEGYKEWRESFLAGKAGVFTISVKESVEYMEQTMLHGHTVKES